MFPRLLLLFVVTPVVELFLLIRLGQVMGIGPTLALIVATAIAGSWLTRREGVGAWQRVQSALAEGRVPGTEMLDGLIILVSGALLLTPGVLTDVLGFAGLLPPTRRLIRGALSRRLKTAVDRGTVHVQFHAATRQPRSPETDSDTDPPHRRHVDSAAQKDSGYETSFGGAASRRPSHATED